MKMFHYYYNCGTHHVASCIHWSLYYTMINVYICSPHSYALLISVTYWTVLSRDLPIMPAQY